MKNQVSKAFFFIGAILFGMGGNFVSGQEMPKLIETKGPEASSIQKVIDVPVSMYSGIANVSIPLYEISIKGVNVPISLTYNGGGGIKVDEEATSVGLGWRLNYGGSVSRTLKGVPDERAFFGKQTIADFLALPDFGQDPLEVDRNSYLNYTKSVVTSLYDLTPDEFNFSAGGYSGKYMYKQSESRFILYPKEDILVNYNISNNPQVKISSWDLTMPDGTKYNFGGDGAANSQTVPDDGAIPLNASNEVIFNMWSVKKITTTSGESINYSYYPAYFHTIYRSTNEYYDFIDQNIKTLHPSTLNYLTEPIIQSITFPNGNISFSLSDRVDLPSKRIDEMIVRNSSNEIIRKIAFVYDYFYGNYGYVPISYRINSTDDYDNKRLKLNAIQVSDSSGNVIQTYRFDYYTGDGRLPSKYSFAQDCWGYFNGAANTTWVPKFFQAITTGADRKVNNAVNNVFALKSVTYPTGGKSEFTYEGNVAKTAGYSLFDNLLNGTNYVDQTPVTLTIGTSAPNEVLNGENCYYQPFTVPDNGGYPTPNGWNATFGANIPTPSDPNCNSYYAIFDLQKFIAPSTWQSVQSSKYCNGFSPYVLSKTLDQLTPGSYRLVIRTNFPPEYTQNLSLSGLMLSVSWRNYIPNSVGSMNVGGLRIKEINYFTDDATLAKRTSYSYLDNNGLTSGAIYSVPYYLQYASQNTGPEISLRLYGSPTEPFESISGSYIGYTDVKQEVIASDNPADNIVTKYSYSFLTPIYQEYASPTVFLDGLVEKHEWQYGKLLQVEYEKQGKTLKTESYAYSPNPGPTDDFADEIMTNHISWMALNITLANDFTDDYIMTESTGFPAIGLTGSNFGHFLYGAAASAGLGGPPGQNVFATLTLPYKRHYTGLDRMTSKTTTYYDGPTPVTETENYFYEKGPAHYQMTKVEKKNSKNQLEQQQLFYPSDFTTDPIYSKMVSLNMKNVVIKKDSYRDGNFLTSVKTNYFDWGNNLMAPKSFETTTTTNPSEIRGQYDAYDISGNFLSLSNSSAPPTCRLYSYNNQYVIAEISNADYNTVQSVLGGTAAVANFSNSNPTDAQVNAFLSPLRTDTRLKDAQMTTYTCQSLVGVTSQTDVGNRVTYYEYDGLQRLKRIRDQDYNILKSFDYQYQASSGCGGNCYIITMQTLAGTNTLGYPVGVFNVHGKLLGNATGPVQYDSLWNADTADVRIGTLATGGDSLHFNMTLNTGMSLPSGVTGCRYYQVDLTWNRLDGVRNFNGAYIDFGDGTGMRLGKNYIDTPAIIAPNTTYASAWEGDYGTIETYFLHTYADFSLKTLTLYHNDATESEDFDNYFGGTNTGLQYLSNLRGNLPQNTITIGGSCYQIPSMTSLANVPNWNSISTVKYFRFNKGDGFSSAMNISYAQDFMKNNRGLIYIYTSRGFRASGYLDTAFKLTRLKSDWNTYFTDLQNMQIGDDQWNREDLSALTKLNFFQVWPATQDHQDSPNSPLVPIPSIVIDNILNQIAAGAGQTVTNGVIDLESAGTNRTTASDASVSFLKSKGWAIAVNGSLQ